MSAFGRTAKRDKLPDMRSLLTLRSPSPSSRLPCAIRYQAADGKLRVSLAPTARTQRSIKGPDIMAAGGIQKILADLGATVRVEEGP